MTDKIEGASAAYVLVKILIAERNLEQAST